MHERLLGTTDSKDLTPIAEGEEPAAEQIQADSDAIQEAPKSASAPVPYTPTQAEREAHEISHWPYRAWCRFCVQGRGKNLDHARMEAELNHGLDTISIDFMYLGQNDDSPFPVLAFRVHSNRWTESYQCVSKSGRDVYNILALVACIKRIGLR